MGDTIVKWITPAARCTKRVRSAVRRCTTQRGIYEWSRRLCLRTLALAGTPPHDTPEPGETKTGGERHRDLQAAPEVVEAQNLPALLGGDAGKLGVGVDDHGVPDGAQHRQVGLRVGVGKRSSEVDALPCGKFAQREHLALAVVERP